MDLNQALNWVDNNSEKEAVERLRSRKVAKTLAEHVRRYRHWIKKQGELTNTCTRSILGDVCENCNCKLK